MRKRIRRSSQRLIQIQQGLSIVEVMASATILALIALGAASFIPTAFRANKESRDLTAATQVINRVMEEMRTLKFDDVRPYPFTTEPIYAPSNQVALINTTTLNFNSPITVCLKRATGNPSLCESGKTMRFPYQLTFKEFGDDTDNANTVGAKDANYRVDLIVYKGKYTHLAAIPNEMTERFAMAALPEILLEKGLLPLSELLNPPAEAATPQACAPISPPTSVEAGTSLTFTGSNTYNPETSVRWTFQGSPNTIVTSAASPFTANHTWVTPGTYQVQMHAIKSNGTGPVACTGSPFNVTVNAPTPVDFTVSPGLNSFTGVPFGFSVNTTQCPLCTPANTSWDMPSCTPATFSGLTANCSYSTAGAKTVNLKRNGLTVGTKTINISDASIVITSPPANSTYTMGQNVSFAASCSSCGGSPQFIWNFGDAAPAYTGQTATHAYANEGLVTAQVTVKDGSVNPPTTIGIQTVPLIIAGGLGVSVNVSPAAGHAGPDNLPSTTEFSFQTASSGLSGSPNNPTNLPVTYSIWYGDGNATSGAPDATLTDSTPADTSFPVFTHKYAICGNYTATVKAEVGAHSAQGTTPVNVASTADIAASETTVTVGGTLSFTGSTEGNGNTNTYNWTFLDDNSTQSGQSVSHAFNVTGTQTVNLSVSGGCGPSATKLITVLPDASSNQAYMKKIIVKVSPFTVAPPNPKDYLGSAVFLKANNDS